MPAPILRPDGSRHRGLRRETTMTSLQRWSLAALLALAIPAWGERVSPSYAVTDLGTWFPTGVNDSGWITGYDGDALLWTPSGGLQVLASCAGCSNRATAINNFGQITGFAYDASYFAYRAVVWQNGVRVDLGDLPSGNSASRGDAINVHGEVAGQAGGQYSNHPQYGNQGFNHAVRFAGAGDPIDLEDHPSGTMVSLGRGINDAGAVVGQRATTAGWRAIYWSAGDDAIDLGALWGVGGQGTESFAWDINCSGQAALQLPLSQGQSIAALWHPAQGFTQIGRLPGYTIGIARAVNDAGLVVGVSAAGSAQRAMAWTVADGLVDLNARLHPVLGAGWTFLDATAVSESGLIVGRAYSTTLGYRAVLLTPNECAGFVDVDGNDAFCASVAWLKSRGVTAGCGNGGYCPDAEVSRLAMAGFMQRLGTWMEGQAVLRSDAPGALDIATAPLLCATDPIPAKAAWRRATLDGLVSGSGGGASFVRARLMVSEDDGTSWRPVHAEGAQATFAPGAWRSVRNAGTHAIGPYKTLRYALRLDRGASTDPSALADSVCRLRVHVGNGLDPAP